MVHNPKVSQAAMTWCAEAAIGLIFNLVDKANARISRKKLRVLFAEEYRDEVSSQRISKMVYELERRKYIEICEGDSVKLTNKAKIKIIDRVVAAQSPDLKFRIVSFDIPETKRTNRNNFRRAIKRMGFKQIQKSLWVTHSNVGEYVELAAKEYSVSDYIAYFVADASNVDAHINGVLSLKDI